MYMCTAAVFSTILVSLLTEKRHTLKHFSSNAHCTHLSPMLHIDESLRNSWQQALPKIAVPLDAVYRDLERRALPARNSPHALQKNSTPSKWLLVITDLTSPYKQYNSTLFNPQTKTIENSGDDHLQIRKPCIWCYYRPKPQ